MAKFGQIVHELTDDDFKTVAITTVAVGLGVFDNKFDSPNQGEVMTDVGLWVLEQSESSLFKIDLLIFLIKYDNALR